MRARRRRPCRLPRLPPAAEGTAVEAAAHRGWLPRARHAALRRRARARAARRRRKARRRPSRSATRSSSSHDRRRSFGGSFDPPHRGHVELARRAKEELGLDRLVVLVSADPGHKQVETPADVRLRLARAAFPDDEVVLDEHARTVDTLRAHPEWDDPVFLIGADEFSRLPLVAASRRRCCVARGLPSRRGPASRASASTRCSRELEHPERVRFFELEPTPVASTRPARPPRGRRGRRRRGAACGCGDPGPRGPLPPHCGLHWDRLKPIEQARRIAALAQDKLARDVVILDMRPVCAYTDYFVVCTGGNAAPDESDLGRGARAAEAGERPAARVRPRAAASRRGSSATTSTSCCTSSRPRRASSTASRSCGTTSRTRRSKQPRPKRTCLHVATFCPSRVWHRDPSC